MLRSVEKLESRLAREFRTLQKMVGITRTKDIVMRSRRITGQQALDWGIVTECVADADLEKTTDALVAELKEADILVIGAPIYNFSVPTALKAWIDMIARARLTFRYTEKGVEGLLLNKKAYIVVPSGGVPVGSPVDFATPYLRHALAFVGIDDIEIVAATGADRDNGEALDQARAKIAELVHLDAAA